jgi:hypothetical protein
MSKRVCHDHGISVVLSCAETPETHYAADELLVRYSVIEEIFATDLFNGSMWFISSRQ